MNFPPPFVSNYFPLHIYFLVQQLPTNTPYVAIITNLSKSFTAAYEASTFLLHPLFQLTSAESLPAHSQTNPWNLSCSSVLIHPFWNDSVICDGGGEGVNQLPILRKMKLDSQVYIAAAFLLLYPFRHGYLGWHFSRLRM